MTKMLQKGVVNDFTHQKIFRTFKILVNFLKQVRKML